MMVLRREEQSIEHRRFGELKMFLRPGELLVLNDTRVLPAKRVSSDGAVEFLFLERIAPRRWKCSVKPGRKMRAGATAKVHHVTFPLEEILPEGEGVVSLDSEASLYAAGVQPLRRPLG